jgi:transcriptional regulator with PAS, ATPase and Fis domain
VAKTNASVLIQGESGTGKALVARAIHYNSPRRKASFVEVNCASLPESLLENELFGHEKGAFTGALQLYRGRFERADGGTIFLDEVSELSLSSQAKLLRVLQEREFERLGGKSTIKVDVRVIASTNRNLEALVREGKFREDLYYRLNVVSIIMPPLRTRKEDIPIYVDHFIRVYSKDHQKSIKGISQKAMDELLSYSWPGNVRELQNVIERAVVIAEEELILPEHLPFSIQSVDYKDDTPPPIDENLSLSQNLERVEEYIIKRALLRFSGNRKLAATFLGISEKALQQKIRRYKIG